MRYAARWPDEVHLAPDRDVPELAGLDPVERDQLATIFLGRARPYESDDGKPISFPSIHAWHQATARTERDVSQLFLR